MKRKYRKYMKMLESEDPKARHEAVLKLGLMADTELIPTLDRVANLDENMRVRGLASKAVNTLEILKQRELDQQRAAQMAAEDDDGGIEWRELASVKMLEDDITEGTKKGDDWSFVESKKRDAERKRQETRQKEQEALAEAERRKRAQQRRRRPFRIALALAVTLAIIGLVVVVWYLTQVDQPPDTRQGVLEDLRAWNLDLQASAVAYQDAFDQPSFECEAVTDISVTEPPTWVTLTDVGETDITSSPGALGYAADELSAIDESLLEGYEDILFDVDRAYNNLNDISRVVGVACSGEQESVTADEWDAIEQIESIGGVLIQALRSTNNAASAIETAQAAFETPTDADDATSE